MTRPLTIAEREALRRQANAQTDRRWAEQMLRAANAYRPLRASPKSDIGAVNHGFGAEFPEDSESPATGYGVDFRLPDIADIILARRDPLPTWFDRVARHVPLACLLTTLAIAAVLIVQAVVRG